MQWKWLKANQIDWNEKRGGGKREEVLFKDNEKGLKVS